MSKTSAIRNELVAAAALKDVLEEKDEVFLVRLISATGELSDAAWEDLSAAAQDWFNDAVDAVNSKKTPPDFPDYMEEKATEKTSSRRGGAKSEPKAESDAAQVGDMVIVTMKRGKVSEGKLLEVDADIAIVEVDGEEVEFSRERVESIVKKGMVGRAADDAPDYEPAVDDEVVITTKRGKVIEGKIVEIDANTIVVDDGKDEQELQRDRIETIILASGGGLDPGPYEPAVGDTVTITNKRGKIFAGPIVEMDDEVIVLDVDGSDVEVPRDRIETIVPVGAKASAAPEKTRGGKDTKAEEKTERGSKEPATEGKATKIGTTANGGISVSTRTREIILDDPKISAEALLKVLDKEGLKYRELTIIGIHKELNRVLTMMRDRKMLK